MMTFLVLVFIIASFVAGMGVGVELQKHFIKKHWRNQIELRIHTNSNDKGLE